PHRGGQHQSSTILIFIEQRAGLRVASYAEWLLVLPQPRQHSPRKAVQYSRFAELPPGNSHDFVDQLLIFIWELAAFNLVPHPLQGSGKTVRWKALNQMAPDEITIGSRKIASKRRQECKEFISGQMFRPGRAQAAPP